MEAFLFIYFLRMEGKKEFSSVFVYKIRLFMNNKKNSQVELGQLTGDYLMAYFFACWWSLYSLCGIGDDITAQKLNFESGAGSALR